MKVQLSLRILKYLTKLCGGRYIILDRAEYEQEQSAYSRKLAECEQIIASLQVDQEEFMYLRHFAATLIQLEKRLHSTDNASEILILRLETDENGEETLVTVDDEPALEAS